MPRIGPPDSPQGPRRPQQEARVPVGASLSFGPAASIPGRSVISAQSNEAGGALEDCEDNAEEYHVENVQGSLASPGAFGRLLAAISEARPAEEVPRVPPEDIGAASAAGRSATPSRESSPRPPASAARQSGSMFRTLLRCLCRGSPPETSAGTRGSGPPPARSGEGSGAAHHSSAHVLAGSAAAEDRRRSAGRSAAGVLDASRSRNSRSQRRLEILEQHPPHIATLLGQFELAREARDLELALQRSLEMSGAGERGGGQQEAPRGVIPGNDFQRALERIIAQAESDAAQEGGPQSGEAATTQ
ncbi:unnamed protein product, partial [Polarella glacialis]